MTLNSVTKQQIKPHNEFLKREINKPCASLEIHFCQESDPSSISTEQFRGCHDQSKTQQWTP